VARAVVPAVLPITAWPRTIKLPSWTVVETVALECVSRCLKTLVMVSSLTSAARRMTLLSSRTLPAKGRTGFPPRLHREASNLLANSVQASPRKTEQVQKVLKTFGSGVVPTGNRHAVEQVEPEFSLFTLASRPLLCRDQRR